MEEPALLRALQSGLHIWNSIQVRAIFHLLDWTRDWTTGTQPNCIESVEAKVMCIFLIGLHSYNNFKSKITNHTMSVDTVINRI